VWSSVTPNSWKWEIVSEEGILFTDRAASLQVDLAKTSALSLPSIPARPGAHGNSTAWPFYARYPTDCCCFPCSFGTEKNITHIFRSLTVYSVFYFSKCIFNKIDRRRNCRSVRTTTNDMHSTIDNDRRVLRKLITRARGRYILFERDHHVTTDGYYFYGNE